MTVREIFNLAESLGVADKPLSIDYTCDDDWFNWSGDTGNKDVTIEIIEDKLGLSIVN